MNMNLQRLRQSTQKMLRTLAKLLATKLAILFHIDRVKCPTMHTSHQAERSLFDLNGSRKYLNTAEQKRFLLVIQTLNPEERLFCTVLSLSGGRVSEVLSLTPRSVDVETGDIAFQTLKRRKLGFIRQIPLPRKVITECDRQFGIATSQLDSDLCHRRLWPWSRTTAWRLVRKTMLAARITGPAASPKGLRHTFGVSAFQANVPPHLVQRWLGHASIRTTAIYAEVKGAEERQFAARMWRRLTRQRQ
jgi:integrase/recombinase XerD